MKSCDRIEIHLTPDEEHETPEDADRDIHTDGYAEAVRDVMDRATGEWGWCSAHVNVVARKDEQIVGEGNAYLGHCSYLSADDFVRNSGYFDSMVEEAMEEALSD